MTAAARTVGSLRGWREEPPLSAAARCLRILTFALLIGLAPGAVAGAAAPVASAVGALTDAGGQVVFDFPRPVGYGVTVGTNQIVVTFTEPFTGSLQPMRQALSSIVGRAELSADRKVATLYLRGAYSLKSQAVGASIILDLVASEATRAARAGADPAAAGGWLEPAPSAGTQIVAAEMRTVDVSYARHDGYERLIFDWRESVPYSVEQGEGTARIEFRRPGRLDLPTLKAKLASADFRLDALPGDKSMVVTLGLPENAAVRHALSGGRVIVDIAQGLTPVSADRLRHSAGGTVVAAPEGAAAVDTGTAGPPEGGIHIAVTRADDRVTSLRFDWPRSVAAAAFRRGRHVWLAFDSWAPIALDDVRRSLGGTVFAIEQVPNADATVLRLAAAPGVHPVPRRAGLAWIVDFDTREPQSNDTISIQPQPNADQGSRVLLRASGARQALEIGDPDAGDTLVVVPVGVPGMGIVPGRAFAEFRLLPTVQGVALERLADDVSVTVAPEGIAITRPTGLRLAPRNGPLVAEPGSVPDDGRPMTFDFARWMGGPAASFPAKFVDVKSQLQNAIAAASPAERNARRLALARFYFAHGFAADALGAIRAIVTDDAEAPRDASVLALRGAVRMLLNDLKGAARDLNDKRLDADGEVGLWRGALAALQGDWRTAMQQFERSGPVLRHYPKPLRQRFGLLAAEAAILAGRINEAQEFLTNLDENQPDDDAAQAIAYMRGRLLASSGQHQAALDQWKSLEETARNPVRVKAALARIELLAETGRLDTEAAIERLDRLRFAWRGDETEFAVLHRLARLHLGKGNYREGLDLLRETDRLFPELAETAKVRDEMARVFAELFIGGGADRLPPIRALALFDDYKELAPAGEAGDAMIGTLVDRLVSVDLLSRAAELLEHQIKTRLKGPEKARVGARLALLRLIDRKPDAALAALKSSLAAGVAPELAAERNRLNARAMADLDKPLDALSLLEGDKSEDADLLRADIHWRAQNWAEAGQVYGRLAASLPTDGETFDATQSRLVLSWAVALALAGDKPALAALRARCDGPMAKSPYGAAYRIVAHEIERGNADYASIVANIAEVAQFQAFLANYRDRLQSDGLSRIN